MITTILVSLLIILTLYVSLMRGYKENETPGIIPLYMSIIAMSLMPNITIYSLAYGIAVFVLGQHLFAAIGRVYYQPPTDTHYSAVAKRMIVFEGIDGSGKSTISKEMAIRMNGKTISTKWLCEPSHDKVGSIIRELLLEDDISGPRRQVLLRLFSADREMNLSQNLQHLTDEDYKFFIYDRYKYSTLAYQNIKLDHPMNTDFPEPGLTIFLDTDVETALERLDKRGGEKQVYETSERLTAIDQRYRDTLPDDVVMVSTNGRSVDDIMDECEEIIEMYIDNVNAIGEE